MHTVYTLVQRCIYGGELETQTKPKQDSLPQPQAGRFAVVPLPSKNQFQLLSGTTSSCLCSFSFMPSPALSAKPLWPLPCPPSSCLVL